MVDVLRGIQAPRGLNDGRGEGGVIIGGGMCFERVSTPPFPSMFFFLQHTQRVEKKGAGGVGVFYDFTMLYVCLSQIYTFSLGWGCFMQFYNAIRMSVANISFPSITHCPAPRTGPRRDYQCEAGA